MKSQNSKVKGQNFKSKLKTFYFLIVFLTFDFLFLNLDKAAAADLSLGIYPPIIQIQIEPPANIDTPITIENHGQVSVALEILFKPFGSSKEENGEIVYLIGKKPLIFENIKISEDEEAIEKVVIPPKQSKTLELHIDIPRDEPLSDYYFSVLFVSENKLDERLNQLKIQGGIATNVLLSIKGIPPLIGAKPTSIAKIVEFSSPSFLEKGPVPFTVRLKNQSNHFITPQGTISIKNILGKTIGQVKLSPVNILADTIRSQETLWQETFLFGPYTATLNINPSDKGPTLIKTVHFFVFPFRAFIILIAIAYIILFVKNRLKRYRKP